MARIESVEELRRLYKQPVGRALAKQMDRLDPHCRRFIDLAPFVLLATSNGDGWGDVTPRGGPAG